MRKTDKKIDNQIRQALTAVCEHALDHIAGFQWLTHHADYKLFPQSLRVICVFDTNASLTEAYNHGDDEKLRQLIWSRLQSLDIRIADIEQMVSFTSEEHGNMNSAHENNTRLH
mgnify:FL=1